MTCHGRQFVSNARQNAPTPPQLQQQLQQQQQQVPQPLWQSSQEFRQMYSTPPVQQHHQQHPQQLLQPSLPASYSGRVLSATPRDSDSMSVRSFSVGSTQLIPELAQLEPVRKAEEPPKVCTNMNRAYSRARVGSCATCVICLDFVFVFFNVIFYAHLCRNLLGAFICGIRVPYISYCILIHWHFCRFSRCLRSRSRQQLRSWRSC